MSKNKTKQKSLAVFYAYAGNAADHLAPYAVLCKEIGMNCIFVIGEMWPYSKILNLPVKRELKKNGVKIVHVLDIASKRKFYLKSIPVLYKLIIHFGVGHYGKKLARKMIKFLLNNKILGNTLIGRIVAKQIKESYGVPNFVFCDNWSSNSVAKNEFLLEFLRCSNIVIVGHTVRHYPIKISDKSRRSDIVLATNCWHADSQKAEKKFIIGSPRFSKEWVKRLDKNLNLPIYSNTNNLKIAVLASPPQATVHWQRMLNLIKGITMNPNYEVRFKPHVRSMSRAVPPAEIEKAWDVKTSLSEMIIWSDIVLFWSSSAIFEAVVRKKPILYLSFLSKKDGSYVWQADLDSKYIINDEKELSEKLQNYYESGKITSTRLLPFEKLIWPVGNSWSVAKKTLIKLLDSDNQIKKTGNTKKSSQEKELLCGFNEK
jgi:hypothetical protein